jgi:hypothetical protein
VGALATLLARHPAAWVGGTLLVCGVVDITACAVPGTGALCWGLRYSLRDPDPVPVPGGLELTWEPGGPLLTAPRVPA